MRLARYAALIYFGFVNSLNVLAADPAKVKSIADYLDSNGVQAVIMDGNNFYTGKGKSFKIKGSLKDSNESIEVRVFKFVKDGQERLSFVHNYSPAGKKPIKFEVYEIKLEDKFDGKIDGAFMIEGPSNSTQYEVILDKPQDAEVFQNAHDISIDQIVKQLP